MNAPNEKGLGGRQTSVLRYLRGTPGRGGPWNPRSPEWYWTSGSETQKILDSLVKRGLAYVDEDGTYHAWPKYMQDGLERALEQASGPVTMQEFDACLGIAKESEEGE